MKAIRQLFSTADRTDSYFQNNDLCFKRAGTATIIHTDSVSSFQALHCQSPRDNVTHISTILDQCNSHSNKATKLCFTCHLGL